MDNNVKVDNKLPCSVIQDLLPLYHDGVVREETSYEVDIHMKNCAECRKSYEEICQENDLLATQEAFTEEEVAERNKGYNSFMKKNRRKGLFTGIIFGIIIAAICLFCWYGTAFGLNVVKYEEVEIWYEIESLTDEKGNSVEAFSVNWAFKEGGRVMAKPVGSNQCLKMTKAFNMGHGANGRIYPMNDLVTGEPIIYNSYNELWLRFSDQAICIRLDEVAEELGLQ